MRGKTLPRLPRGRRRHRGGAGPRLACRWSWPTGRQRRGRRAVRQHDHPAPDDRAERVRARPWARSGTHRGATLVAACVGGDVPEPFGGKSAPASGQPVDAHGHGDRPQGETPGRARADPGARWATARPPHRRRRGGADPNRTQALGLSCSARSASSPRARKLVVVKTTDHFMGVFRPHRQEGDLRRLRWPAPPRLPHDALHEGCTARSGPCTSSTASRA